MKLLSVFQSKLEKTDDEDTSAVLKVSEDEDDEDDEDVSDMSWLHHKLVFENQERSVKDASVRDENTFEIFDPRNPINKRRREASAKLQGEKRRK